MGRAGCQRLHQKSLGSVFNQEHDGSVDAVRQVAERWNGWRSRNLKVMKTSFWEGLGASHLDRIFFMRARAGKKSAPSCKLVRKRSLLGFNFEGGVGR